MTPKRKLPECPPSFRLGEHRGLLVGFLLGLFLCNALYAAVRNSAVCDELGAHIPSGYLYATTGVFSGGINNFPLGQLLIALPLRLLGHSYELFTEQHLLLFRLPVLVMGVLLGILVYRFASDLYGWRAGLGATFLFAFSPNILAHSSLATLDLPNAFFIFLAIHRLYRYVKRPSMAGITCFGAALGAALLVKVQALLLIPIVLVALALFLGGMMPSGGHGRRRFFAAWLIVPVVCLLLVNLVYLHLPLHTGHWLPAQFVDAVEGKLLHSGRGHFAYLLGQYSARGWWYYFPVAILLKTPLPLLALIVVGLFRRPSREVGVFVLLPMILFLAAAMHSRVNIGLRHVLMLYPFLMVLGGQGLSILSSTPGRLRMVFSTLLLLWYCAQAALLTPHQLSYFNVLVGGPRNGHRYLIDSNFDWGQNDLFLKEYVESRGIPYRINPDPFTPSVGNILVNANALYGVLNGGPKAYAWLDPFDPVRQIAYTWFEYNVPEESSREPPRDDSVRKDLLRYLFSLRERFPKLDSPEYRLRLADLFANLDAYDVAFEELRAVLSRHPGYERALSYGGELIVRHKLGVLHYRGDEYLTGFRTERPPGGLSLDEAIRIAHSYGGGAQFSALFTAMGAELAREGDGAGALEALGRAVRFDPTNQRARAMLKRLGGARRLHRPKPEKG